MMAFFIMKKNNFIVLVLLSFLISFYNFDFEDWFFISEPDIIKSMTQDSFNIHFLADNGIFSYDYMDEYFYYNTKLSYNLPEDTYHYIYYHQDRWQIPDNYKGVVPIDLGNIFSIFHPGSLNYFHYNL